jgi:SAM-dependent methyltransferase
MSDAATTTSDQLVERLFGATLGALELLSVYLGWRLELYRSLADAGPLQTHELATRAGIDERYAREWLEQQATAGLLTVDDVDLDAEVRRYALPPEYADVLVDPESLAHVAPFAALVVGIAHALPEVADAYRTGAGVPYPRYGTEFRDGQGAINRPAYHHELSRWIAVMSDIDARLRAAPRARVADLGCGQGWSTIALARAYPDAEIIGVDSDPASIEDAAARAKAAGVEVAFVTSDADLLDGTVDLACIFEALHDMARPVEVLAAARRALAPGGAVLVVDERVADTFTAPGDEVERMMYGWSVLHCLPASRAETPSAALGTVLRASTVERLARDAGFASVDVLDIENDFFRFYRLSS